MIFKKCEHCGKTFSPQLKGMGSMLCRPCIMDCELAYNKIFSFLRKNQDTKIKTDKIAEGAEVPTIFVLALMREGRFDQFMAPNKKPTCKSCKRELGPEDGSVCTECSTSLQNKIQTSIITDGTKEDIPERKPVESLDRNNSRKYGLGR